MNFPSNVEGRNSINIILATYYNDSIVLLLSINDILMNHIDSTRTKYIETIKNIFIIRRKFKF